MLLNGLPTADLPGADDDDSAEMAQKLQEMGVINSTKTRGGHGNTNGIDGPIRESVRVGKMNLVDLAGRSSPWPL